MLFGAIIDELRKHQARRRTVVFERPATATPKANASSNNTNNRPTTATAVAVLQSPQAHREDLTSGLQGLPPTPGPTPGGPDYYSQASPLASCPEAPPYAPRDLSSLPPTPFTASGDLPDDYDHHEHAPVAESTPSTAPTVRQDHLTTERGGGGSASHHSSSQRGQHHTTTNNNHSSGSGATPVPRRLAGRGVSGVSTGETAGARTATLVLSSPLETPGGGQMFRLADGLQIRLPPFGVEGEGDSEAGDEDFEQEGVQHGDEQDEENFPEDAERHDHHQGGNNTGAAEAIDYELKNTKGTYEEEEADAFEPDADSPKRFTNTQAVHELKSPGGNLRNDCGDSYVSDLTSRGATPPPKASKADAERAARIAKAEKEARSQAEAALAVARQERRQRRHQESASSLAAGSKASSHHQHKQHRSSKKKRSTQPAAPQVDGSEAAAAGVESSASHREGTPHSGHHSRRSSRRAPLPPPPPAAAAADVPATKQLTPVENGHSGGNGVARDPADEANDAQVGEHGSSVHANTHDHKAMAPSPMTPEEPATAALEEERARVAAAAMTEAARLSASDPVALLRLLESLAADGPQPTPTKQAAKAAKTSRHGAEEQNDVDQGPLPSPAKETAGVAAAATVATTSVPPSPMLDDTAAGAGGVTRQSSQFSNTQWSDGSLTAPTSNHNKMNQQHQEGGGSSLEGGSEGGEEQGEEEDHHYYHGNTSRSSYGGEGSKAAMSSAGASSGELLGDATPALLVASMASGTRHASFTGGAMAEGGSFTTMGPLEHLRGHLPPRLYARWTELLLNASGVSDDAMSQQQHGNDSAIQEGEEELVRNRVNGKPNNNNNNSTSNSQALVPTPQKSLEPNKKPTLRGSKRTSSHQQALKHELLYAANAVSESERARVAGEAEALALRASLEGVEQRAALLAAQVEQLHSSNRPNPHYQQQQAEDRPQEESQLEGLTRIDDFEQTQQTVGNASFGGNGGSLYFDESTSAAAAEMHHKIAATGAAASQALDKLRSSVVEAEKEDDEAEDPVNSPTSGGGASGSPLSLAWLEATESHGHHAYSHEYGNNVKEGEAQHNEWSPAAASSSPSKQSSSDVLAVRIVGDGEASFTAGYGGIGGDASSSQVDVSMTASDCAVAAAHARAEAYSAGRPYVSPSPKKRFGHKARGGKHGAAATAGSALTAITSPPLPTRPQSLFASPNTSRNDGDDDSMNRHLLPLPSHAMTSPEWEAMRAAVAGPLRSARKHWAGMGAESPGPAEEEGEAYHRYALTDGGHAALSLAAKPPPNRFMAAVTSCLSSVSEHTSALQAYQDHVNSQQQQQQQEQEGDEEDAQDGSQWKQLTSNEESGADEGAETLCIEASGSIEDDAERRSVSFSLLPNPADEQQEIIDQEQGPSSSNGNSPSKSSSGNHSPSTSSRGVWFPSARAVTPLKERTSRSEDNPGQLLGEESALAVSPAVAMPLTPPDDDHPSSAQPPVRPHDVSGRWLSPAFEARASVNAQPALHHSNGASASAPPPVTATAAAVPCSLLMEARAVQVRDTAFLTTAEAEAYAAVVGLEEAKQQLQDAEVQRQEIAQDQAKLIGQLEEQKADLSRLGSALASARADAAADQQRADAAEHRAEVAEQRIEEYAAEVEALKRAAEEAQAVQSFKAEEEARRADALASTAEVTKAALEELQEELITVSNAHDDVEEQLSQAMSEVQELTCSLSAARDGTAAAAAAAAAEHVAAMEALEAKVLALENQQEAEAAATEANLEVAVAAARQEASVAAIEDCDAKHLVAWAEAQEQAAAVLAEAQAEHAAKESALQGELDNCQAALHEAQDLAQAQKEEARVALETQARRHLEQLQEVQALQEIQRAKQREALAVASAHKASRSPCSAVRTSAGASPQLRLNGENGEEEEYCNSFSQAQNDSVLAASSPVPSMFSPNTVGVSSTYLDQHATSQRDNTDVEDNEDVDDATRQGEEEGAEECDATGFTVLEDDGGLVTAPPPVQSWMAATPVKGGGGRGRGKNHQEQADVTSEQRRAALMHRMQVAPPSPLLLKGEGALSAAVGECTEQANNDINTGSSAWATADEVAAVQAEAFAVASRNAELEDECFNLRAQVMSLEQQLTRFWTTAKEDLLGGVGDALPSEPAATIQEEEEDVVEAAMLPALFRTPCSGNEYGDDATMAPEAAADDDNDDDVSVSSTSTEEAAAIAARFGEAPMNSPAAPRMASHQTMMSPKAPPSSSSKLMLASPSGLSWEQDVAWLRRRVVFLEDALIAEQATVTKAQDEALEASQANVAAAMARAAASHEVQTAEKLAALKTELRASANREMAAVVEQHAQVVHALEASLEEARSACAVGEASANERVAKVLADCEAQMKAAAQEASKQLTLRLEQGLERGFETRLAEVTAAALEIAQQNAERLNMEDGAGEAEASSTAADLTSSLGLLAPLVQYYEQQLAKLAKLLHDARQQQALPSSEDTSTEVVLHDGAQDASWGVLGDEEVRDANVSSSDTQHPLGCRHGLERHGDEDATPRSPEALLAAEEARMVQERRSDAMLEAHEALEAQVAELRDELAVAKEEAEAAKQKCSAAEATADELASSVENLAAGAEEAAAETQAQVEALTQALAAAEEECVALRAELDAADQLLGNSTMTGEDNDQDDESSGEEEGGGASSVGESMRAVALHRAEEHARAEVVGLQRRLAECEAALAAAGAQLARGNEAKAEEDTRDDDDAVYHDYSNTGDENADANIVVAKSSNTGEDEAGTASTKMFQSAAAASSAEFSTEDAKLASELAHLMQRLATAAHAPPSFPQVKALCADAAALCGKAAERVRDQTAAVAAAAVVCSPKAGARGGLPTAAQWAVAAETVTAAAADAATNRQEGSRQPARASSPPRAQQYEAQRRGAQILGAYSSAAAQVKKATAGAPSKHLRSSTAAPAAGAASSLGSSVESLSGYFSDGSANSKSRSTRRVRTYVALLESLASPEAAAEKSSSNGAHSKDEDDRDDEGASAAAAPLPTINSPPAWADASSEPNDNSSSAATLSRPTSHNHHNSNVSVSPQQLDALSKNSASILKASQQLRQDLALATARAHRGAAKAMFAALVNVLHNDEVHRAPARAWAQWRAVASTSNIQGGVAASPTRKPGTNQMALVRSSPADGALLRRKHRIRRDSSVALMAEDSDAYTFSTHFDEAAAEGLEQSPGAPMASPEGSSVDPLTPVTAAKGRADSALKASARAAYAAEQSLSSAEVEMFSPIRPLVIPSGQHQKAKSTSTSAAAPMPPSPSRKAKPLTALAARMLRRNQPSGGAAVPTATPVVAAKESLAGGNVRKSADSDFWALSDDEDENCAP